MGNPNTLNLPKPLSSEELELLTEDRDHTSIMRIYAQDVFVKHEKSNLKILVKAEDLRKQQFGRYSFIKAKAVLTNDIYDCHNIIELTCRVACGRLYKLKDRLSSEDEINIFDHLDLLLPTWESVGLITYQNGIQNTLEDFEKMGDSIIEKFVSSKEFNPPVFPLCIGIYNKTTGMGPGVILDYNRIW
ncbi:MAG: hypothetical protein LW832_05095, partial [Parachlamydia sp.]|nr:hypothetical protein [Parachlamydia sp.]